MNRGQRLKQKKHRRALEAAKYVKEVWQRDGKGKKTGKKFFGSACDMTRIRL